MKIVISINFIILTLLFSCTSKKPKIKFDLNGLSSINKSNNYGFYTIQNVGSGDLKIHDYKMTCDCISMNLEKGAIVKPTDSLIVRLEVNQEEKSNSLIHITIKTNAKPALASFEFRY